MRSIRARPGIDRSPVHGVLPWGHAAFHSTCTRNLTISIGRLPRACYRVSSVQLSSLTGRTLSLVASGRCSRQHCRSKVAPSPCTSACFKRYNSPGAHKRHHYRFHLYLVRACKPRIGRPPRRGPIRVNDTLYRRLHRAPCRWLLVYLATQNRGNRAEFVMAQIWQRRPICGSAGDVRSRGWGQDLDERFSARCDCACHSGTSTPILDRFLRISVAGDEAKRIARKSGAAAGRRRSPIVKSRKPERLTSTSDDPCSGVFPWGAVDAAHSRKRCQVCNRRHCQRSQAVT